IGRPRMSITHTPIRVTLPPGCMSATHPVTQGLGTFSDASQFHLVEQAGLAVGAGDHVDLTEPFELGRQIDRPVQIIGVNDRTVVLQQATPTAVEGGFYVASQLLTAERGVRRHSYRST